MRLRRTFSKLKKKIGSKWSFSNYFDTIQYKKYLEKLKPERRKFCIDIPHGTIHSNEANGMCFRTPFGNIIVLSYALRHFLFYMNIFHYGEGLGVKDIDVFYSLLLAIRIMMGTESLDFEIDPRGRLPSSINKRIKYLTDWQMRFIIGHEFAHHYLGHLENKSNLKSHSRVPYLDDKIQHYTHRQKCEFEADFHSIAESTFDDTGKTELLNGAFTFFLNLHIYYKIEGYMFPKSGYNKTHPESVERILALRNSIKSNLGFTESQINLMIKNTDKYMDHIVTDFLPFNVDKIEMIGSTYLPNYRKKVLIDRLDI